MKFYKNKYSIIITDKIVLAVSASNRELRDEYTEQIINKRFYTYRATIPKIFLNFLIKNNDKDNEHDFTLIPKNNREYYFTNTKNIREDLNEISKERWGCFETKKTYKIMGKSKDSYKITLPKSSLIELYAIDRYLDTLEVVKDRTKIFLYFKLKIDLEKDKTIVTFKFNNKYSSDRTVKSFKKKIFSGDPLIYHYLLASLRNGNSNNNYDINDIAKIVSKSNDEIINNINENYDRKQVINQKKLAKIKKWKNNLCYYKSKYDINLIKTIVEENNKYYINLWDIRFKDNVEDRALKMLKFDIDDVLVNNEVGKYVFFPVVYINYKGVIFETSHDELNNLDKDIMEVINDFDEFMALLLEYKEINNRKKLII